MTSRRNVLKTAAAAAIATARHPILGANDRVQIGQIGFGGRGNDHVESYATLQSDARIVGLCDVNQAARERGAAKVAKLFGAAPKEFADMRAMFESKDVDAVSITTPNHWHALATIWACQAGKDVYVEKPASHNMYESVQMVKAARKYKRMVQVGSQSRSTPYKMAAIKLLQEGAIGQIYHARGLCYRRRFSIGHTPDEPVPAGLDWSFFLGPAQMKPYSKNKFAYNWHWFWDTGNGDIGNQGVHEMDIALWGLGRTGWPQLVSSIGGKYVWQDDQETPNTLETSFDFGDAMITFDTRNMPTQPEGLAGMRGPNYVGNIFYGSTGFMVIDGSGYQIYKSTVGNLTRDQATGAGAGSAEKYEKTADEKPPQGRGDATPLHMKNFIDGVKSRDYTKLNAEIEIGARSASYCHLGNIAYRVRRTLRVAESSGKFVGDDEAQSMQTRNYRAPYLVPSEV